MTPKKKSKFFTFIFSFMPGAAEMYMGFMKSGLTLMTLFVLFFLALALGLGDFFGALAVVVWFFAFFHAVNYSGLNDEEFSKLEDMYIWDEFLGQGKVSFNNKTVTKWIAAVFIIIGISMLWSFFSDVVYRLIPEAYWDDIAPVVGNIPEVIVSILLIVIGFRLVVGKKKELDNENVLQITMKEDGNGNNQNA